MNCDGVRGLLSAYVDGELSAGELLRVEQHLRRCHACADDVDSLRQTIALVASLDEVEVPASFHAQLHDRLAALGPPVSGVRRTKATPPLQRGIRKWAMPAAAAAAVLAIGLTSLQQVQDIGPNGSIVHSWFPADIAPKSTDVELVPGTGNVQGSQPADSHGKNPPNPTDTSNEPKPDGGDSNVNQPRTTVTPVTEDGSHVVTHTGTPTGETNVKPLTSYTVSLTATTATGGARQSLLAIGSAQEMHDGVIRITVPVSEREATMAAIGAIAGLTMTGEPQTTSHDYAAQLAQEAATLELWQSAVTRIQRQLDSMQDASDRQAAQVSLVEARQHVANTQDSIRHLESEAGKAIFEIRLQAAAQ